MKITLQKKVSISLIPLVFFTLLNGCKKGEEDPFISLRSRKARVVGEWEISQRSSSYSTGNPAVTCTSSYDGTTEMQSCGSGTPSTSKITHSITFEKDGTFRWYIETIPSGGTMVINDYEGIWNFNSGVGDLKKKEQINLSFTKITTKDAFSSTTTETKSDVYTIYDIIKLKNKEMVFHSGAVSTLSSNGYSNKTVTEETITLTSK